MLSESGQCADDVRKGDDAMHARNGADRRVSRTRAMLLARGYDDLLARKQPWS